MLRRGNDNPYLKGRSPKKHVSFVLTEGPNPLQGLDEAQRKEVVERIGKGAHEDFDKHLKHLQVLLRKYNPLQILAHFGYYDHILLDGSRDPERYIPAEQSAVEWLQALVLQFAPSLFCVGRFEG